jgi:RNA polymerase sigma-70 factor (ECF subfamily)
MGTPEYPLRSCDDDRLVGEAVRGQRHAAEILARRYLGRVFGLALRMMGNNHDAEDAAQEAMLRTIRFLPSYRPEGTFDRWVLKVASNTCLDMLRRQKTLRIDAQSEAHLAGLAEPESDPAEALAAERLALVENLLAELPDQQRAVFVLFHYEGRSLRDVAEAMDMPEGTVRSALHRARRKLRDRILLAQEGCSR